MRVLFVTATPPWPPEHGDSLIAHEQIRRLGDVAEIHLATLPRGQTTEAALARNLGSACREVTVLPGGHRPRRALHGLYNGLPALANMFFDTATGRALDGIVAEIKPDLVHVNNLKVAAYFRGHGGARALDLMDANHLLAAHRAKLDGPLRRRAYAREARLLLRYERQLVEDYPRVLMVARSDANQLAPGNQRIVVNPNGVSLRAPEVLRPRKRPTIVFHGSMDYFPNIDAALYLAHGILPRLRALVPDVALRIVGRRPTAEVRALHDGDRIVVTGEVPDVARELAEATVGVYPLRAGSGIQNKVLEALAVGLPSVVSERAIAGVEHAVPEVHVLLARDDHDWVETTAALIADAAAQERLAQAGRELIAARYSWDENAARVLAVWHEVLAEAGGGTAVSAGPVGSYLEQEAVRP
jgi:glycosyltransferase involved in cell wall biosynthesis